MRFALNNVFGVLSATALLCLAFAALSDISASAQSGPSVLLVQSQADADRKSAGCLTCHTSTDSPTMHITGTVRLGCTDCHGGNSDARIAAGTSREEASPSAASQFGSRAILCQFGAGLYELVARKLGLRPLRKSRRLAGCGTDLRKFQLSYRRSAQGSNEHDDAWRHAVGRGTLQ